MFPSHPTFEEYLGNETFRHPTYIASDNSRRKEIRRKAAKFRYDFEYAIPFQKYFNSNLDAYFRGRKVLDLGCMTGGRAVAWAEKYQIAEISGIDVSQEYIDAASEFAREKGINAKFWVDFGEKISTEDGSFDTIVTYDVLEHVRDPDRVFGECHRVLKPGGHLIAVFPSFYQPLEHHLTLVTRTPGLQWLFPRDLLMRAYVGILDERGQESWWYARKSPVREPWEALDQVNGLTYAAALNIMDARRWSIKEESYPGLFLSGRRAQQSAIFRTLQKMTSQLAKLPLLREVCADRLALIAEKR